MPSNNNGQEASMLNIHQFSYKQRAGSMFSASISFVRCFVLSIVTGVTCLTSTVFADPPDNATAEAKPGGHQYELNVSKDDKLCHYMLNVLNRSVAQNKARFDELDDSIFEAIKWTRYGAPADKSYNYGAEYTKFDINNDGQNELVVRFKSGSFHSIDADFLFIFPENFSIKSLHQAKELETRSSGSVEIGREGYELRLLPPLARESWMKKDQEYFPGLVQSILIRPFLFGSKYYLLLSESPDVRIDPELLVVTRYISGHVSYADPSQMSDVCYFSRPERNPTIRRY